MASDTPTTTWSIWAQDGGTLVTPTGTLVSLGDVKSWINYPNPTLAGPDDALLTNLLYAACSYIEQEIGPVAPTSFVERFDGWGGDTIVLRHAPVISISYVNEYQSTGGLLTLTESTPAATVDGYQTDKVAGYIKRVFKGNWPRTFFPGSLNIEVSYTAGRSPLPPTLALACLELVAHWWEQGHQANARGFGAVTGDAYDAMSSGPGQWIGVPAKVTDKLKAFRTPVFE